MTQTTPEMKAESLPRDLLAWATKYPVAASSLVAGDSAVLPFKRGDAEQMGALYGKIGYANVRLSFEEARLDK